MKNKATETSSLGMGPTMPFQYSKFCHLFTTEVAVKAYAHWGLREIRWRAAGKLYPYIPLSLARRPLEHFCTGSVHMSFRFKFASTEIKPSRGKHK